MDDNRELLDELAELELPKAQRPCPECHGQQGPCDRCDTTGTVERYAVQSYEHAMRVAEQLSSLVSQQRERASAFDARLQRLQADREAALKPLQRRQEWLQALLLEYHAGVLAQDKRQKTIALCENVRLKSRTGTTWLWPEDNTALMAWAEQHGYIRQNPALDKESLKKAAVVTDDGDVQLVNTETGEVAVVPGVTVVAGVTFKVEA